MPAIEELSADQLNTVRSGGLAGECRIAPCLNTVIFQAEITQTILGSVFAAFTWDNATVGAYTDCIAGQTVFITLTDDATELRRPLFRGRVRKAPTSDTFYINETSLNLNAGYIITVIDTYEVWQRDRNGLLYIDYDVTYTNLLPYVKNMEVFYYGEDAVEFQFSFAPVGQAMAFGATIASYAWVIPGATYDVGNAATQNITVTVPYGRIWAHLTITDSNGLTNVLHFEILVCDRDDPVYMYTAHDGIQINVDLETGLNASVTYFAGVDDLLNRTRLAIIAFDNYKSGSGVFSNIMFVGYFVQEDTQITAELRSSTLSETRFEIQSFAALAGQQFVPLLAIRNKATPTAWDEMKEPTPARIISYLATRYSTLGTLVPIDFQVTDSTWFSGDNDLEGQTLLASINHVIEEINAALVFYPQGDARLEINANFLSDTDRDALPDLILVGNITSDDLYNYALPLPYYDTIGQVQAGFASFQTSGTDTIKLEGLAPASAWLEGSEQPVILAQLLPANLSSADAITEAEQRIGDLLEFLQPPELLNLTFNDAWRFLTCSQQVWVTFDLPATDSTRGLAITSDMRYILQSLAFTWNLNGTWDVTGTARLETLGGNSQIAVTISPNVIDTSLPVLPALSDYDSFVPDGTLNYLSNTPDDADLQPYRSPRGLGQYTPMTTENAANSADNTNEPGCVLIKPAVNFKSSTTRTTPSVTVNGEPYTITVKGSARLQNDGWSYTQDFRQGLGDFTLQLGTFVPGVGIVNDPLAVLPYTCDVNIPVTWGASTLTSFIIAAASTTADAGAFRGVYYPSEAVFQDLGGSETGNYSLSASASVPQPVSISTQISNATVPGTNTLVAVTFFGTGDNPFTGEPGGALNGDAFYQWVGDDGLAELYPGTSGLLINGAVPSIPPEYNPNHSYTLLLIGDGNIVPFTYQLSDYSDVQNVAMYIKVCGAGMGS